MEKRAIKFRAWEPKYKLFLTDFKYPNGHSAIWIKASEGKAYHLQFDGESDISYDDASFCNVVLQQFTGLLDKNGKEIYEGDICSNDVAKWEVVFDRGCFSAKHIKHNTPTHLALRAIKGIEIIGNIFENPELLTD